MQLASYTVWYEVGLEGTAAERRISISHKLLYGICDNTK